MSWPGRRPAPGFTPRVPDFEAFFEALPAPCIVFAADDPRYTIVAVNDAYLRATNSVRYGARGLLGRPLFQTFPDPLYDPAAAETANMRISLHRVMRQRAPDRMSVQRFRSRRPDGTEEERLWSPVNAPVLGDDGEVAFIVHHVEDVTARFSPAEPSAEKGDARATGEHTFGAQGAAAYVDLAFAQAPVAIAVLRGRELVFACCNRAYGALAGHRPLVGRSVREAFPELDVGTIQTILQEVYTTAVPYVVNEFPVHGEGPGPEIYYNFVYQPLTDADGTVTGIAVLATDITELVLERLVAERGRAEAETARNAAEEASRAKSRMLGTLSHEMRTPLNAIAGYTQLLGAGVRGPVTPAQLEDIQRIRQNQLHLTGVVNSVLRHAKLENAMLGADLETVPVADICAAVESLVMPQMREKGLTFAFTSTAPDLFARADPVKVRQILLNLLSNAVKFTPEGGHVSVTCGAGEQAGTVAVRVADTGVGIARVLQEKIFEPFVQVGAPLSSDEGVGLGLWISRALARAMGGDLSVRSELGQGAVFTLTLPSTR
ncbi:MAG: PAS domain-containing protein [Gemmatimonadetes bacterium]|nr:PAS domain-containing protein [Gemmatimonadota bacterium]